MDFRGPNIAIGTYGFRCFSSARAALNPEVWECEAGLDIVSAGVLLRGFAGFANCVEDSFFSDSLEREVAEFIILRDPCARVARPAISGFDDWKVIMFVLMAFPLAEAAFSG